MKIRRRDFTSALLAGGALQAIWPQGLQADDRQKAPAATPAGAVCPKGHLRFQILGSSAGKPVPRPFCVCPACVQAREKGGRNCRTRTSMNIYTPGDVLGRPKYKVDLSPDAMHHLIQHLLDDTVLEHLLFTHSHDDHCDPSYLGFRSSAVSGTEDMKPLHVYGGADVERTLLRHVNFQKCKIDFHRFDPFREMKIGDKLTFFSLRANHGSPDSLNYVVQSEGLTVLLAWDTGVWSEDTWRSASRFCFNAVFMECTVAGPDGRATGSQHLNCKTFLVMKQRMADLGLVKSETPFVAMHIGDNGRLGHEQLQEYWTPHGVTVGYDGLLADLSPEGLKI
jgi:phosphoribosyl 1,2-cyclic phosphate phosphodiesterase